MRALKMVEKMAEKVNASVSEHENHKKMQVLWDRMSAGSKEAGNMAIWKSAFGNEATVMAPHRTYIREGQLQKHSKLVSSRKMYTFILLSDALLYGDDNGKSLTLHAAIPLWSKRSKSSGTLQSHCAGCAEKSSTSG